MPVSVHATPSPPAIAPAAVKPLIKSSRKRRNSDISSGSSQDSATRRAAKKLKVSFDDDVQVRFVDELGEKSVALVHQEIRHALTQHAQGQDEEYLEIKSIFTADPRSAEAPSDTKLEKYLVGLTQSSTSLTKSCADLVDAILNMEWLARDQKTVSQYTRFLGNLISSQSGYASQVLRMLVDNFTHVSRSAGPASSHLEMSRPQLQDRIHRAIKYLIDLVPSATSLLASLLASKFPGPSESKKVHIDYIKNALRVTDYARAMKSEILDLVTERLIKIDVQVQIDVEDLADEVSELLVQGNLDGAEQLEDDESDTESLSSDESVDPEEERIDALRGAVEKMDAMMDYLFDYYTPTFQKGNPIESHRLFDQLLSQFSKTVLPTYRSRHTQFLLFHFAQASQDLLTAFVESCLKILKDRARSSVIRQSAAAYIASFVARGSNVQSDTILHVFHSLADYIETQRKENEPACRAPDLRRYNTYYAAMQALIYIFCFRWRDLLQDPEDYEDLETDFDAGELVWSYGIKDAFNQNFMSPLNPLKICAPEIVDEFARIAHHLQFMYIYPRLESNKRLRLSTAVASTRETSLTNRHGERFHQLDAYFPFDPYQLPLSKRWLVGDYNEWKGLPGLHDADVAQVERDSSDEEDEEREDEDDAILDQGTETPDEED